VVVVAVAAVVAVVVVFAVSVLVLQGAPKSNNPLGKIRYLWNCSTFFHQIHGVYRGGFKPHILHISLQYFVSFRNYNYLNLNVHFSK